MAFFKRFILNPKFSRLSSTYYDIPERYRNSFYLVNASFFDHVNWYLHRAYEAYFSTLVSRLRDKDELLDEKEATRKVLNVIHLLDQCNCIIDIRFPIQRDNGKKEIIRGFRAQHGLYSGFDTCLGGLRLKGDITRDHMKALSVISTYKHSCMGIRLAGGHGGIKINPESYSERELQRIIKRYAAELYAKGFCDGVTDVIEPDINTSSREMSWIASIFPDNYEKMMVVGKPPELGGIDYYSQAASQGVFFAMDYFLNNNKVLEKINMTEAGLAKKTFIIQGLGTLGGALAKYLENSGAICIGIKEIDSYVYDGDGIDVRSAIEHKGKHGTLQNFKQAKPLANDDIFKENCDILILAALQKSMICFTADKVKAKVIVEAANGSITPTSHKIFLGRDRLVLPDIYVASGHSVASYLEYLLNVRQSKKEICLIRYIYKNILETFNVSEKTKQVVSSTTTQKIVSCDMKPDVLTYAIDHVMSETGNELLDIANEFKLGLDLRTAGYVKAIQTIHNSIYELNKY